MCPQDGPFLPLVCLLFLLSYSANGLLTSHRVGGVVSETSFKFFIQFVFYTAVFCAYSLIVCAVFIAELKREVSAIFAFVFACPRLT